MERSYDFTLPQQYNLVESLSQTITYPIRNAQVLNWESKNNYICEQTFDGRYGYLYYYEFWIDREETIPIFTDLGDLHLNYTLLSDIPLKQMHHGHDFVMDFVEERGAYLYLAKGEYSLTVPKGHHILVGFILDAGLFRPPANRNFDFLQHLVIAKKERSFKSAKSITFNVCDITKRQLSLLFSKINPNILDNEHMLLKHLIFLIQLSRFKLLKEKQTNLSWIDQARILLEINIQHQGAKAKLSDIAHILSVTRQYLNKEHKKNYGCKFHDYRNQILLEHIATVIAGNEKLATTAEECGFSSSSEMNNFIKKRTNLTALNFKLQQ